MHKSSFRQPAKGTKIVFYAVAIQRLYKKTFFMQSLYSGYAKKHFLCNRHTAEATFMHFSYRRHTAEATFMHFSYRRHTAEAIFILFSYYRQTAKAIKIHFSYRRHSAKAIKTNLAAHNGKAQGTKMLFCCKYSALISMCMLTFAAKTSDCN